MAKHHVPDEPSPPYWQEARRPMISLALLVPLAVAYEAALWWLCLHRTQIRMNALHAWLDEALSLVGMGTLYLCPLVGVFILLCRHIAQGDRWRVSSRALIGVLGEGLVFACVLVLCDQMIVSPWLQTGRFVLLANPGPIGDPLQKLVLYVGAGIYEETVFRLILLPLVAWLLVAVTLTHRAAAVTAVLVTALAFAVVHYVGPLPYAFNWPQFLFRAAAGAYFGFLFLTRGFMVAVGAHAGFDLISGLVLPGLALR